MVKIALLTFLCSLICHSALAFGGDYQCSNGSIEINVYLDGPIYEELELDQRIFENNHSITMSEDGTNQNYKGFVAVTHDGAGQDSFIAFVPGRLTPLKKVADFYYEHEGAYLVGGVYSYLQKRWIEFDHERMKCQF